MQSLGYNKKKKKSKLSYGWDLNCDFETECIGDLPNV